MTAKRLWVRDRLAVLSDLSVTGVNLLGVILRSLAWGHLIRADLLVGLLVAAGLTRSRPG